MKLPKYKLKINPDKGELVDFISLVEDPAIESNFLSFKKESERFSFNDERMELLGPALIPNKEIYRKGKDGFEFLVEFEKEEVRYIAQEFFKNGFQSNLNLDHSNKSAESFIFQSFIVDESKGVLAPKGIDAPDGSWIVGVKVNSKEVWSDIKAGKRKGFSIEGVFEYFESHINKRLKEEEKEVLEMIENINLLLNKKKG